MVLEGSGNQIAGLASFREAYEEQQDPLGRARIVALALELLEVDLEFADPWDLRSEANLTRTTLDYLDERMRRAEGGMPDGNRLGGEAVEELYQKKVEEILHWCDRENLLLEGDEVREGGPQILRHRRRGGVAGRG